MNNSIFPDSTSPVSQQVYDRQLAEGGNRHAISALLSAEQADPASLSAHLRGPRADLEKAEEGRKAAERKLREGLAAAGTYQAKLAEIATLQGQVSTAESALLEYRYVIDNAATNFHNWPFQVSRSGHFGLTMREIAAQISTAREMVLLLPPWIEDAKGRLTAMERQAEAYRREHKLEKPEKLSAT
jgi:hypothetical protein